MNYLLLSIITSSSLLIFFKLFHKYNVTISHAIAINYLIASICSFIFIHSDFDYHSNAIEWIVVAVIMGSMFFLIFSISSFSSNLVGIGITSIAMKLGLIFPVIIGLFIYHEPFVWYNIIGLFLGFIAMYYLTKSNSIISSKSKWLLLPIIVWIGSGICDSLVQFSNLKFNEICVSGQFTFIAFSVAAIVGFIYIFGIKREQLSYKSIVGGVALGIPNYFSIYFLLASLRAMNSNYGISSATLFSINNISIVVVNLLIGGLFFNEKINNWNRIGILLALISILLISI